MLRVRRQMDEEIKRLRSDTIPKTQHDEILQSRVAAVESRCLADSRDVIARFESEAKRRLAEIDTSTGGSRCSHCSCSLGSG